MKNMILAGALILAAMVPALAQQPVTTKTVNALSLIGEPKYKPGFDHFDFVNPDAPKGGSARLSVAPGSFDSLNPYIVAGTPPRGVGLVFESLTQDSLGEPSTAYGLIAETITVPSDSSWVEYALNPKAKWHDGKPITPEDVIFSFNTLMDKGTPFWAQYYHNVKKAEKSGPRKVKFTFDQAGNRELPMIMGQLPVLPKHYWQGRRFDAPTQDPPLGSGPYRIAEVKPGRSISYERVKNYWGKDLPVNRGFYNFDRISYEYFQDETVELEALKTYKFDFINENTAKTWATQYQPGSFPALRAGLVKKEELRHKNPTGMQAFAFNIRRDVFRDVRVREALNLAFDFEWTNKNMFYGQYTRTQSFFSNSDLASSGLPSPAELALLNPLKGKIPPAVFTQAYKAPASDGTGGNRANLRRAAMLLQQAGYEIKGRILVNKRTGKPLAFEILNAQPAFERIMLPFVETLKKLGIEAHIRTVDPAQYEQRMKDFDFDMTVETFPQSNSPGNEQREFWSSGAAARAGSRNVIGIRNPAVDALIDKVIYAPDRAGLLTATRALDRVLLNNHYVIPMWHTRVFRIAYWDKFGRPANPPEYHHGFPLIWWLDAAKDAALKTKMK
ncbi:extracellular solute-binding protein [Emcibacter sp. SYSU 3D8]|uniref:extracellular solute-binding protein n=1 Tax=Emcibacter sp. SYSU 3D8 TaxID=3133969 RepID=UPI0031FEBB51